MVRQIKRNIRNQFSKMKRLAHRKRGGHHIISSITLYPSACIARQWITNGVNAEGKPSLASRTTSGTEAFMKQYIKKCKTTLKGLFPAAICILSTGIAFASQPDDWARQDSGRDSGATGNAVNGASSGTGVLVPLSGPFTYYVVPDADRITLLAKDLNPAPALAYWSIEFAGNGDGGTPFYLLRNVQTNKCLDILGNGSNDGTLVTSSPCSSLDSGQWWRWGRLGLYVYQQQLVNSNNKCLDVPVNYPDMNWVGTPLQIYKCGGHGSTAPNSLNQLFEFRQAE